MKLSFSIQNWKDLEWNEFCTTAAEVRLQGIELYNVKDPMFGRKDSPVNPELAAATRRNLIRQKKNRMHLKKRCSICPQTTSLRRCCGRD